MKKLWQFAGFIALAIVTLGASFPYVTLNNKTNRLSDNGAAFTRNGVAIGGGGGIAGTVSNNVASAGLLAVDASKTNGIAATAAHITNAWGIFTGDATKAVSGAGTLVAIQPRMLSAKAAGCALDTSLSGGGGTDDTAILQSLLDQATNSPIVLVMDGPALITGLNVRANTTIWCLEGAGFYLADNSNRAIVRNFNRSRGAITDEHIRLIGGFYNGNRDNQSGPGPTPSQEADNTWISGIVFNGINYLTIENVIAWHVKVYGIWVSNANRVSIRNCLTDVGSPTGAELGGQDGIHVNGPAQYISMTDIKVHNFDDAIALNANDGTSTNTIPTNQNGPYIGQGDITDVTISGVELMDSLVGFRLLSMDKRIDRIVINNVAGRVGRYAAVMDYYTVSGGNFGAIQLNNWNVGFYISSTAPDCLMKFQGTFDDLRLSGFQLIATDTRPLLWFESGAIIRSLMIDGFDIYDPSDLCVPIKVEGTITSAAISLDWRKSTWASWTDPITYAGGGAITHLRYFGPSLDTITTSGITASRAVVTDANQRLTNSIATATEVSYLSGVTSGIQDQINNLATSTNAGNWVTSGTTNSTLPGIASANGYVATNGVLVTEGTLTHAGTLSLDFTRYQTMNGIVLTGACTVATANLAANHTYTLIVNNPQATNCTLTFPSWLFNAPSYITAGKVGVLSARSRTAADTNVIAAWVEFP